MADAESGAPESKAGLFSVFCHPALCCEAFCCTYCQVARQFAAVGGKEDSRGSVPLVCCLVASDAAALAVCGAAAAVWVTPAPSNCALMHLRQRIRSKLGMRRDAAACASDAVLSVLCPFCVVGQQHLKLSDRGMYPGGCCCYVQRPPPLPKPPPPKLPSSPGAGVAPAYVL
eukprot:TRINITY_DN18302_c0_g1_i1.p1 TRINITY_DN18302_c0_g1~~TRINITY_DN18302_c0_g1_i1.p1  ORF type:complete len:172 (+),score=43.01 TRINITY_DN18302_c0_g1_i1:78-593(+)